MKILFCFATCLTFASCYINDVPEKQIPIGNFIYGTWIDTVSFKSIFTDSTLTNTPTVRYTFNIDGSYKVTDENIILGYTTTEGEFSFNEHDGIISFYPDSDVLKDSLKLPHFITKWQVNSIDSVSMELIHQISIKDSIITSFKNYSRVFAKLF